MLAFLPFASADWTKVTSAALFYYVSFRSIAAFLTAFFLCIGASPVLIRWLRMYQKNGQPIRTDGPESHLKTKQGTPTMGGLIILGGFFISSTIWAQTSNPFILWLFFVTFSFGGIGLWDDLLKVTKKTSDGLTARRKTWAQISVTILSVFILMFILPDTLSDTLHFPFFKHAVLHLAWLFPVWGWIVLAGSANAVNLTDGLDGLAVGPLTISLCVLGLMAYFTGHKEFSQYLYLPFIPGASEVAILCSSLVGACLGFLWYNAPPASVFMGDTGSMALGGFLGATALLIKQEFTLAIVGGVFVVETLSVMAQVLIFKRTKKRLFLMAPLHHHFEKKGWSEPMIVIRFWIISLILGIIALATLKVR